MTTTLEIPLKDVIHPTLLRPKRAPKKDLSRTKGSSGNVSRTKLLSFVIPLKDEEATLVELHNGIRAHVPDDYDFEIIFVDDGSQDSSWQVVEKLVGRHPEHVRGIRFRRNAGKAAGLTAGFRAARGDFVFTMDADLQDDPQEIPRFLAKLEEGYGLVSGWKKVRHDPWHKVVPSRIFNWMLSRVSGVRLHDHNCGFKCYRGELARQLTLHGELHRMVPSLAAMLGYTATEIVVTHHPRQFGRSKYGSGTLPPWLQRHADDGVLAPLRRTTGTLFQRHCLYLPDGGRSLLAGWPAARSGVVLRVTDGAGRPDLRRHGGGGLRGGAGQ